MMTVINRNPKFKKNFAIVSVVEDLIVVFLDS